jgi:hypothetical protein
MSYEDLEEARKKPRRAKEGAAGSTKALWGRERWLGRLKRPRKVS